jgi:hypothetical protein
MLNRLEFHSIEEEEVDGYQIEDSVPLYAPGQNSRNEKYIQTIIIGGNLSP